MRNSISTKDRPGDGLLCFSLERPVATIVAGTLRTVAGAGGRSPMVIADSTYQCGFAPGTKRSGGRETLN